MKASQVNKLYSKLTPHEQAALSFDALVRGDEAEADAIVDSVPRVIYQCVHNDYQERVTGLFMLVGDYGINYWKTTAALLMACNLSSDDENMDFSEMLLRFLAKIASMDAALTDVCQLFKVDVESVKKLADCEDQPAFSQYVDAELVEQYTELFTKAVNFQ
jgi:hypothetical protein